MKRLDLIPFRVELADEMYAGLQSSALYEYIDAAPPPTVESLRERYARLAYERPPNGSERWLNWVLYVRAAGAAAGYVQATVRGHTALVAYVLFVSVWGMAMQATRCTKFFAY